MSCAYFTEFASFANFIEKGREAGESLVQCPMSNVQSLRRVIWPLISGLLDIGHWTLDIGLWTLDIGHWILDFGHWTLDFGLIKAHNPDWSESPAN
jgi:hypothetical protein